MKKKRYLVLHAVEGDTGFLDVRMFNGNSPTLKQLQAGVGGYIEPVDWIRNDPVTRKPVAHLADVSFVANEDAIAMGLPLNILVPFVTSVRIRERRAARVEVRTCPLFGDIVAFIPEENGGGGLSDEQIEACFELFAGYRSLRDELAGHREEGGKQDGEDL